MFSAFGDNFHFVKMDTCNACVKTITVRQSKLTCADCGLFFHGACYNMSKAEVECFNVDGLPFRCKPCASVRRKSLKFDADLQEGKMTLEDIMEKILEIGENQKKQEGSFNTSFESLNSKLDNNTKAIEENNSSLKECMKLVEKLTEENRMLNGKVMELEKRVEEMEQYSRANTVEIQGVPMSQNEDVVDVVKEVGKALDFNIKTSMIDTCHRMGRRTGPNNQPPGIIVKFVRRIDKEELLRKRRVKRTLSTRHMTLAEPSDHPVYINEALTPTRRRLLAEARRIKREKEYKFLWVRGGKIFMRKEESASVTQITCQADLSKL